ncbi:hypothetical protein KEJ47_09250 [Candidatus Bathyarchaeota archaeon]|nr:hypothetical protein [Candidatus Bathyarchaeota archaeon]
MRRVLGSRAATTILAYLFFLLITLSISIVLLKSYFDYNATIKAQSDIESEKIRENLKITSMYLDETDTYVRKVTVKNSGSVEAKIRSVYKTDENGTVFVHDPSFYIPPGREANITLPDVVVFDPQAKITLATERGTKTQGDVGMLIIKPEEPKQYDPSKLFIGPLMLEFDSFCRQIYKGNQPQNGWIQAWNITSEACAFNITVKNIDVKNITLNKYSSLILEPLEKSSPQSWYLKSSPQKILVNQTVTVVFIWDAPSGNKVQTPNLPSGTRCMVFLTFFGEWEKNGVVEPYAQTIPFEANMIVS